MSKVGMRRETFDARETLGAPRASRLTPRRVSGLTSRAPWPKVKIGEVLSIKHGYAFEGDGISSEDNGVVLVTPGNFKLGGGFKESNKKFFTKAYPESYVLKAGDFIVTMTDLSKDTDTLGYSAKVPSSDKVYLHNQRIGLVEVFNKNADREFVYWFMRTRAYQRTIAGCASGVSVKHTSPQKIYSAEIPLPPLPVQRQIADILSAYDDLIENNRRRIAILEETARLAYRKWFGGAEQSWGAKHGKVSDFFDVSIGRTPPRKNEEYFSTESTDLKWLSIKDMRASCVFALDTAEKLSKAGIEKTHIHVSPPGTIFLSFKLTVGEVVIAGDSMATNEAIAHFETNDRALRDYTYFYLSSFQYDKLGSTSAIARAINSDIVRKMDFVLPARNVLERFEKDVEPMFDQIENLTRQNAALAAARDMLLPRLMKGEGA